MKKIVVLAFLLIVFCSGIYGQTEGYIINNTLGKFEGTWQWVNGNDTVKVFLRKEKVVTDPAGSFAIDLIIGYHVYKKGNLIIEDSYSKRDSLPSKTFRSMSLNNTNGGDVLSGTLRDLRKRKTVSVDLSLNATQTTLTWHSSHIKGTTVNEIPGYTLPRDLVLIKQ